MELVTQTATTTQLIPPPPLPPSAPPPPPQIPVVQKYGSPPPPRPQPLQPPARLQLTVVQNYGYSRNVQNSNTEPPSRPVALFTRTPCFDYDIPPPLPPPPPPPQSNVHVVDTYGSLQNVQHFNTGPPPPPVALFTRAPCFDYEVHPPPPRITPSSRLLQSPPPTDTRSVRTSYANNQPFLSLSLDDLWSIPAGAGLFTRIAGDESEHLIDKSDDYTNTTKGSSTTAGIQHSEDRLDDVDGAMFSRISQTIDVNPDIHHNESSENSNSDEWDTGAFQRVQHEHNTSLSRVEDNDTDILPKNNSTFFVDLEDSDFQGLDLVDASVQNTPSVVADVSQPEHAVYAPNTKGYLVTTNNNAPLHNIDIGFTQGDIANITGGSSPCSSGGKNGATYTNESPVSVNHITKLPACHLTQRLHDRDPVATTDPDNIKASCEYSELTARGIGSRINHSMSDIYLLDNLPTVKRIMTSCNDVLLIANDFSIPPRKNASTTRISVGSEINISTDTKDFINRAFSEKAKSTSKLTVNNDLDDELALYDSKSKDLTSLGFPLIKIQDIGLNCEEEFLLGDTNPTNIQTHDEITPELAYKTGAEHRTNAYITHEHNVTNSEDNDSLTESQVVLLDDAAAYGYTAAIPGLSSTLDNEATPIQPTGRSGASLPGSGVKAGGNWGRLKGYAVVVFAVFSAILFVVDIGTDLRLAALYHKEEKYPLFYITLTFIIAPSILMGIVDLSWIYLDRKSQSFHQDNRLWTVFRLVFGCLSFGRVIRAGSFIRHHVKSLGKGDNREWHRKRSLEEKRDYYMLDFINAFAECAPQLLVQLYLMYKYTLDLWVFERVVSLLSSWISIAWTYTSYYKCHRDALPNKNDVTTLGFVCFLLSLLPALAGRFVCFALFITYFRPWAPATLLVSHSVVMVIIILCQSPSLIGTATSKWGRTLYSLFFAYVSLFSFVNLRDDRARVRMTMFYILFYVENCIMAALVIWRLGGAGYPSGDSRLHRHLCTIAVPACMVLHVGLVALYYSTCHPTIGRFNKHRRAVVRACSNVAVN